jgi:DNA invertase Pin-like site-specific DNA recombinase
VFDAQGVSFVSVTQQFNTTTSMGRLTLNILLSFAQFEREVTYPTVLRPIRAGGHRRAHSRQVPGVPKEGPVDGRPSAPRLRHRGSMSDRQ